MSACPAVELLEGERDPALLDHVRDCASCRAVVELIDSRGDGDCAEIELLMSATSLSDRDQLRLEWHLARCRDCRDVALLDDLAQGLDDGDQRYAVGDEVGRGGMGRVFEAADLQLDRKVAIKVLQRRGPLAESRFRREALVTARLQHPSVIPIYELGHLPDGTPFYAMKRVQGTSLAQLVAEAGTAAERLALLPSVLAVAEAVAYAHSEGIIHRDLKPSNILVGPFGETLVVDWGLAKVTGEPDPEAMPDASSSEPELTVAGAVLGTPQYMAPEQAEGREADERTDIYALGAVLYHLLAGRPPHDGPTGEEVLEQVLASDPRPIDEIAPGAPQDLRAIVAKATGRDPASRYPSAGDLADDLRRFQTGKLVNAQRYTVGQLVRRWMVRNKILILVTGVLLAALLTVGALSGFFTVLAMLLLLLVGSTVGRSDDGSNRRA